MPEFKRDKSKFTMKGWSPFTKKTDDKKKRESRKGKQFVENTEKAKRARRMATKKAKRSMK